MYPFSSTTLAQLKVAGWTQERRINTTEYARLLEAEGCPILDVAMEFLSRFGDLRIVSPHPHDRERIRIIHFRLQDVLTHVVKINLEDDMRDISLPLTPVGDAYKDMMPLVMDPTGKTYISFDGLYDLGTSGEDTIEALCTHKPIEGFPYY